MEISNIVDTQRKYFNTGKTIELSYRKAALEKLKDAILQSEPKIFAALETDLEKKPSESYMSEVGLVLEEINFALKRLKKWMRPKRVSTDFANFPSKTYTVPSPYGVVLIMSPWNYPFQLTLIPLIGAIAAGNCAVVKPSNYSPATSDIIGNIVHECFPPEYVEVVKGGREQNQDLLLQQFDYIFFTGGKAVGHTVMQAAEKYLTPITLELGGKSPCIVDDTAHIDLAAKRIAFGKFMNAGQTCVAPDYILVSANMKEALVTALKKWIAVFFTKVPLSCDELPKIINEKHFNRLTGLLQGEAIITGGKTDPLSNKIEPTILDNPAPDSPVMQEEIFGPILPVIPFDDISEAMRFISDRPHPLALYLFSTDKHIQKSITQNLSFGGGCINDTIVHLATSRLPFGGVGESGMGRYHGKYSFDTFSHIKGIVKKSNQLDLNVRYHPYSEKKLKTLKKIIK